MSIRGSIARICICAVLGWAVAAAAETWRWTDATGQTHFGDSPPPGVDAERIEVRTQGAPLSDDARAQRARELRDRQSAAEAAAAEEERRAARAAEQEAATAAMNRVRCNRARWALAALDSGRPVYRDASGAYRVKRPPRQLDAYTGPREYLDEVERQAEIVRYQREMDEYCADFPELQDRARADGDLRRAEVCEAAAIEFEHLLRDAARATPEEISRRRQFLDEHCR